MQFIETQVSFKPLTSENKEIIIALLAETGYESFADSPAGLLAYIPTDCFTENIANNALEPINGLFDEIGITSKAMPDVNWNAQWESNFEPIEISSQCRIRAPFHPANPAYKYEIIIEPKMSFGTGHHATTALMAQLIFNVGLSNKKVLDMGCGTGVLAILAAKLGAHPITAIDIDQWAYENTIENIGRNRIHPFEVLKGGAELISENEFDVIFANINRNILLEHLPVYKKALTCKGVLLMSGFYKQDLALIEENAMSLGLELENCIERDQWVAAKFVL